MLSQYSDQSLFDSQALQQDLSTKQTTVAVFGQYLQQGQKLLQNRLEQGGQVMETLGQRAWLLDQLLGQAWHYFQLNQEPDICLLAVGGYGRGELYPFSDIDILLLHQAPLTAVIQRKIEPFISLLWDMRLKVGHSVRDVAECVQQAANDLTIFTTSLEIRWLAGDKTLLQALQTALKPEHLWPRQVFFEQKWAEQQQRHQKYFDTAYNLEPNIKESPGGLRDIHMIAWVAKRHFGVNNLSKLVKQGFLTDNEYQDLQKAQTFLAHVRCWLHHITGRAEDRLGFDFQRVIAEKLGFKDSKYKLAVERFMREYYRTAKTVISLNEMLLQLFNEATARDLQHLAPLNRRFQLLNHYIDVIDESVFKRYPFALLEIFLLMTQNPHIKGIRARTIRLLLHYNYLIDKTFRADLRAQTLFMEILSQPQGITHALRYMNRYGILAAYVPVFGNIVGQMQYDLFHAYTVDQHTLFLIRNLRRFMIKQHQHEDPLCSALMQRLPKPKLIFLAGLFHDIGKGRGGDHSALGAKYAVEFCLKHHLSDHDARLVAWLVRHHLDMSTTAQRQDIADPDVINRFAKKMMDCLHLDYLYLLTVADIRATSPTLWNDWKAELLATLYRKTEQALKLTAGLQDNDPINKQGRIIDLQQKSLELIQLRDAHVDVQQVQQLWHSMAETYFLHACPQDIVIETCAIIQNQQSTLAFIRECSLKATEYLIYSQHKTNAFANTVYFLEKEGVAIMEAYIVTTETAQIFINYTVLEEKLTPLNETSPYREEEIRQGLAQAAAWDEDKKLHPIVRRISAQQKHFQIPTKALFNNNLDQNYSVIEVITTDRAGVLSQIVQAFAACQVVIKSAKIATFGTKVEDVFFITDENGQCLYQPEQIDRLKQQIIRALD